MEFYFPNFRKFPFPNKKKKTLIKKNTFNCEKNIYKTSINHSKSIYNNINYEIFYSKY